MDMTGERRIPAPRQTVWTALNDTEVLKSCIPGCDKLERLETGELSASAAVKIGPISARFSGKVQLLDLDPPNGYRIEGEGTGGVAGFAKGGATVKLVTDGTDTVMSYDVKAQVGGKIAQLGARLIDATAKQMADAFFNRFASAVEAIATADSASAASAVATAEAAPIPAPSSISLLDMLPRPLGLPIVFWVGSAICLVILILMFGG